MRGFIISICLIISLILGIFINSYYVESTFDKLCTIIEDINIDSQEQNNTTIQNIENIWTKKSKYIYISTSHIEIRAVEKAIFSLKTANLYGDKIQIEISLNELKYALNTIRQAERFSIKNIL